jgi:arylsulfatase A-like enzyme
MLTDRISPEFAMPARSICLALLALLLALLAASRQPAIAASTERPNVLFILVDDLGRQDLGIEGSRFHETPHIDALARRSMRFLRGYSACQVCSPSRAAIQTGKSPARLGITDYIGGGNQPDRWQRNTRLLPARYRPELPLDEVTIAEALREAGYQTFFAGKWHLGGEGFGPEAQGYEINKGGFHAGSPPGGYFAPYRNPKLSDDPPGSELPHRLAEETATFIRAAALTDKPFFAMLSFYSVHGPIECAEARWRKFRDKAERLGLTERSGPRFILDRTQEVRQVQDHPVYAGMIAALDDAVGLALAALVETGAADDTVVIFTSDNGGVSSGDGYATSCLPFRGGKGRQWEGGIRQPLFIAWPGVTRGGSSEMPATGMDFYPTILEIVGLPARPEQHLDGISLVPAVKGETADAGAGRQLFWHYPHYGNQGGEPSAMMIEGDWKLIHYFEDGRDELYQIRDDVGEQRDLAAAQPGRVAAMREALAAWQAEVAAAPPAVNPAYSPAEAAAAHRRLIEVGMPRREAQQARFLRPDFVPRGGWWDHPAPPDDVDRHRR